MPLELRNLDKLVGTATHLHDISLSLPAGSFNVLLGPANAGKTSILRLLAGLDQPSGGSIFLHDTDITSLEVRKRDIAFVYQEFVNYPTLTVYENIASPMRVSGRTNEHIAATIDNVSSLLGIGDLLTRLPPSLSGGQQQRVAIARALAKDAEVILLDEPLANLDFKLREELRRELPRLFEGSDKIVVYATTDPNEAFLLGGNTIVLDRGSVCQQGPAGEIFDAPLNTVAAAALSEFPMNFLPVVLQGNDATLNDQLSFSLPAHLDRIPDGDYTLGIRAEHLSVNDSVAVAAKVDACVAVTEITGSETIIHAAIAGEPVVAVVGGPVELQGVQDVELFLDLEQLFVFDRAGKTIASPYTVGTRRAEA